MELFHLLQKYLAISGVEPFQKERSTIVYLKRLLVFIVSTISFMSSLIFIAIGANAIAEYADAFYICETVLTYTTFPFVIFLWKMDSIFKLIEDFEHLIEQRKKI